MDPYHAAALLGSITAIKSTRGTRWAIADIGSDQLAKITLLSWRHAVLGPDGAALPMDGADALGGPLCFSGDTLLPSTDASGLAVGDPILVQRAGAQTVQPEYASVNFMPSAAMRSMFGV